MQTNFQLELAEALQPVKDMVELQISKHGQYAGYDSYEDYMQSLSGWDILQLILEA